MARIAVALCVTEIAFGLRLGFQSSLEIADTDGRIRAKNAGHLFLRIQKTGSTSFGHTMKVLHAENHMGLAVNSHFDWQSAVNRQIDPSNIVTILRDPVERYLSEVLYIAWRPRPILTQNMWDFAGGLFRDGERHDAWRIVWSKGDWDTKLLRWMNLTLPTRNRQMLYLLGFERIPCPDGGTTDRSFCIPRERAGTEPLPSHRYDWDNHEEDLLEKAKEHLRLVHYGLTECMNASVRAIASDKGWNATRAEELVTWTKKTFTYNKTYPGEKASLMRVRHEEADDTVMQEEQSEDFMDLMDYDALVDSSDAAIDERLITMVRNTDAGGASADLHRFRQAKRFERFEEMFDPEVIMKLRRHLRAEIRLYNYALALFNEKHPHEQCHVAPAIEPTI